MSRSIETRVAKLEKAAGDGDLDLGALSDEELIRLLREHCDNPKETEAMIALLLGQEGQRA